MKKSLSLIAILFLALTASSQAFYNTHGTEEFKNFTEKGLIYIATGNYKHKEIDKIFIDAFKENWKATPFKVVKPDYIVKENDVFLSLPDARYDNYIIIPHSALLSDRTELRKAATIGYFKGNGFQLSKESRIKYDILLLNSFVSTIKKYKIEGRSAQVNENMTAALSADFKYNKDKTLLILVRNEKYIKRKMLDKLGLNYRFISPVLFDNLTTEEKNDSYLLYIDNRDFFTYSIFDLEKKQIVHTERFATSVTRKIGKKNLLSWMEGKE